MVIRESILALFLVAPALAELGTSCRPVSNAGSTNRDSRVMESRKPRTTSSVPSANYSSPPALPSQSMKQSNNIRTVDFRNFTYPWYPSYLKSPSGSRKVTLKDGKFETVEDEKAAIKYLLLELDDVSYSDLTKKDSEEAVVYVRGISIFNRFVGCVFIYSFVNGSPKLLWKYEIGDRADGGLRRIEVEDRALIIEQNTLDGAAGLCCPKKFVRRHFKWNGKEFRNTKSETLTDEKKKQPRN
jgi:hypothetical protein